MDCRTASLLSEAFQDDELELVDAARLLAHFEECPACHQHCEEAGRLRATLKNCRPVDRCPEELAKKLALSLGAAPARRARRPFPRSATIVLAAGCGLAVGWAAVRFGFPASAAAVAFPLAARRVEGELVCLRCALERGSGDAAPSHLQGAPHRPVFLTSDGRLFVLHAPLTLQGRLEARGLARRHVTLLARFDESNGLADVVDLFPDAETSSVAR